MPLEDLQRCRPRWWNFRYVGLPRPVLRGYRYVEVSNLGVPRKIITGKRQHNDTEPEPVEEGLRFIGPHDSLSGGRANVAATKE